jgi:NitT/TauT family transport system substrate-binding protein
MSRRRLVAAVVGSWLLVLAATGCAAPAGGPAASGKPAGAGSGASSGAAAKPAAQVVKLRLAATDLDRLLSRAAVRLAMERGWFTEAGLDVEVISTAGGGDTMRVATAGSADIAIGGAPAGVLASLQDDSVKLIAPFNNENPFLIITRAESPVNTVQDLRGRKLGFSRPGSASQGILNLVLERAGVGDVQGVATGPMGDTWTAIRGNVVDAGWSQDPMAASLVLKNEARVVVRAADYVPDYFSDFILVRQDYARQNPQAVRGFLATLDRTSRYFGEQWQELLPTFAGYYGESEDILRATIQGSDAKRMWSVKVFPEAFKNVEQTMRDSGQIAEPVPWDRIFDQQYLPESERAKL